MKKCAKNRKITETENKWRQCLHITVKVRRINLLIAIQNLEVGCLKVSTMVNETIVLLSLMLN